ncbi:MAG: hypothetical protein J3K34DRAFT_442223 [Monoraphidium minutum]|nr:MAG: hypothetical protein J3K34DRAFT_442223 [Monoraphidium minutum]
MRCLTSQQAPLAQLLLLVCVSVWHPLLPGAPALTPEEDAEDDEEEKDDDPPGMPPAASVVLTPPTTCCCAAAGPARVAARTSSSANAAAVAQPRERGNEVRIAGRGLRAAGGGDPRFNRIGTLCHNPCCSATA